MDNDYKNSNRILQSFNIEPKLSSKKVIKLLIENFFYEENLHDEDIKVIMKYLNDNLKKFPIITDIDIHEGIKFGIEIEAVTKFRKNLEFLENVVKFPEGWKKQKEISIGEGEGIEMVSPVLDSSIKSFEQIHKVCNILNTLGFENSEYCGGHIHFDADYILQYGEKGIMDFFELYLNTEDILHLIANPEKSIIRLKILEYASPLSKKVLKEYKDNCVTITDETDLKKFLDIIKFKETFRRNQALNILNIGQYKKNTIEFRFPNGTINPNVWIDNINLFAALFKTQRNITKINNKINSRLALTDEERSLLDKYKKAINKRNPLDTRTNDLLELMFDDQKQRNIYLKRYKRNKHINISYLYHNFIPDESIYIDGKEFSNSKKGKFDEEAYSLFVEEIANGVISKVSSLNDVNAIKGAITAKLTKGRYFD